MKISPARTSAFDILRKIEVEKSFSAILLPRYEEQLAPEDRALCHELVLGVLRRQIWLDRAIDQLSGERKLDIEIRVALRLGVFQLLFLDRIPDHAAVNDSVNLVVRARKSSARGLVNAVLRKAKRVRCSFQFVDGIERVSVNTSHPRWLIEKWSAQFGPDAAEQIAVANNVPAPLAFRQTLKGKNLILPGEYRGSRYVQGCFIADSFDANLRKLAAEGEIYFQEEASQMVAASVEIPPNGHLLDVCAAPGGKTGAIAARFATDRNENEDRLLVAGDLYFQRVKLLLDNLINQGAKFKTVVQYDAVVGLPFEDRSFDTVLVDAPCSGTGTIRHNPEIRYFAAPEDLTELQKTQLAILKNASKLLNKGGTLAYSTCSLEQEENEDVCTAFLTANADFKLTRPLVPDQFLTSEGFARTFPDRDEMDGFFIAAFRRL